MSQDQELIELLKDALIILNVCPRRKFLNLDSYDIAARIEAKLKEKTNEQHPH